MIPCGTVKIRYDVAYEYPDIEIHNMLIERLNFSICIDIDNREGTILLASDADRHDVYAALIRFERETELDSDTIRSIINDIVSLACRQDHIQLHDIVALLEQKYGLRVKFVEKKGDRVILYWDGIIAIPQDSGKIPPLTYIRGIYPLIERGENAAIYEHVIDACHGTCSTC